MKNTFEENAISRRKFLLNGSFGIAAAGSNRILTPELMQTKKPTIKYVTLGRTGMKVSNIGYGTARGSLDPSIIAYAINKGINYFDAAEGYVGGNAERNLGRAVKKYRDKVFITTKIGSVNAAGRIMQDTTKEEIHDRVMACLQRLDTPYIDSLFIHGAGDPDLSGLDNPNLDTVINQLKSEGKVKSFGLSTHSYNLIDTVKHAVASNKVDVMLLSYNYFLRDAPKGYKVPSDWLKQLNDVIKLAHAKNIGIVGMKAFQGMQALNLLKKGIDPLEAKKAAAKWSLNNPNVDVILISLGNSKEIDEFAEISDETMSKKDWETLEALDKVNRNTLCRFGCPAPCMNNCPNNVAIPDVLRINMYFSEYGCEKQAMLEYPNITGKNNAAMCSTCTVDECTKNCMFSIPVKEKLIDAHANLTLEYT